MRKFKTESKKLLDLMINSIYTNREIFLRELISNASDAVDKLYFRSLTDKDIQLSKDELGIRVAFDKDARTVTVSDSGLGMTKDEAIAALNEKYRHKEGPTDVLSFECDGVDDDLSAMTLAEDPVYELGDVIIAPDVAARQTREFGTSFEEEISLLLVHGLLHLCGYDHIADDEAEVMEKREAEILEAWSKRTV